MPRKMVIIQKNSTIISALYENSQILTIKTEEAGTGGILGNIYIGKVKNVMKNIRAAFIDIGYHKDCYYSLEENTNHLFRNSKQNDALCAGDEIVVQVTKDAMKTKGPVLRANLNITGKYAVLTLAKNYIGISSKIKDEAVRKKLKTIASDFITDKYGFILRTNAEKASPEEIRNEMAQLISQLTHILTVSHHRSCYQLIYQTPREYLQDIRDDAGDLDEIITNEEDLYQEIEAFLVERKVSLPVRFYQDPLLPLEKLYQLDSILQKALQPKVWLKSGASIIIEPTEALVSIDVNTGKYVGRKKQQDTFLSINLEAADEIARQIRLRNLSGIILVDFIDMESMENQKKLLGEFEALLTKDPVKTTLVDMTKLGLVEITRKKIKKPLHEQIEKQKI